MQTSGMRRLISGPLLGLLALLCSSAGLAGTLNVNVTPSNTTPSVGDSFTVTVSGVGFPETGGATLGLTFDSAVVKVTGVVLAAGSPFPNLLVAAPWKQITLIGPMGGKQPSGSFAAFKINFTAIGRGKANIALVDAGSAAMGWLDETGDALVPKPAYHQTSVIVIERFK
jgi:hypothetical protein